MQTKISVVIDPDGKGYVGVALNFEFGGKKEDDKVAIGYMTPEQAIEVGGQIIDTALRIRRANGEKANKLETNAGSSEGQPGCCSGGGAS